MISYLASPKPFVGRIGQIQIRAIRSWLATHAEAEVILYGGRAGDFEEAIRLGAKHEPSVTVSRTGAPHFDAIARNAEVSARWDRQVYLNCDILLPPDFSHRITPVTLPRYLIVGQRIDLTEAAEFDMADSDWKQALQTHAAGGLADLHTPTGVDYFVFPRGLWGRLAPLIVGRGGYDGALIAFALRHKVPLIDATWTIPAIHQYHDYCHVAGGLHEAHRGAEALHNYRLHDVMHSTPDISDAEYQLRHGQVIEECCRGDWLRAWELRVRFHWRIKYASYPLRALWRIRQSCGYRSAAPITLNELLYAY
jgi:hypothetical protein